MFRLVYSNRLESLLLELSARVRDEQRKAPLRPVSVVVPSASVESYLRLGVARTSGIAANLDVVLLRRFVAELFASAAGARVADAAELEAMALRLFLDDLFVAEPDLAPVKAYLYAAGEGANAVDLRRVQLAARVGRLFEEYTYSRGEMLTGWLRGSPLDESHRESEEWQRRIYIAMFAPGGLAGPGAGRKKPPVVALHDAVAAFDPRSLPGRTSVHVFGFSHIARSFHALLERIGSAVDVVMYARSPCEGFWEDVDPHDPAPLSLWGRPGREYARALNAAARFDHEDMFVDPTDDAPGEAVHLLRRVQSDVLHRQRERAPLDGPRGSGALDKDESIVVLEHASVRRELEAVASEISRLVQSDPTLRFDDIAVLFPDADAEPYVAQLPAVFHEAYELPHRIAFAPGLGEGHVAEAIDLLLALPRARFTRQDVMRLALHPAVVASLDDVDPSSWLPLCDALGIVHGRDRADHADTYISRDILNWDQGLRRLALGSFMAGDASGDRTPFDLRGDAYLPHEVPPSVMRDVAAFGVLVRSLVADARFAGEASMTMPEWARWFGVLVPTYVAPTGDAEEEELARCRRLLHDLGDTDLGDVRVRYGVACELLRARLAAPRESRSGEGVVVSTVQSMRPIPFRVIFACGMGESAFPSPESEDPLDLRWARRREGDMTARERDKYAFLELLLGARDKLYASYVSRDPLTGAPLSASSVVEELVHFLAQDYGRDRSTLRRRHPLRRWDARYFPLLSGAAPGPLGTMHLAQAGAEARTVALREHLRAKGAPIGREELEERAASEPPWARVAEHLGLARLPESVRAVEGRLVVPMHVLVKFLEFPLQGWAKFRVGLDEFEDDDGMSREDEPFETDRREETVLLRNVLLEARGQSLEDAYDAIVRDRELRGLGPSGLFAEGEREGHLATLTSWTSAFAECGILRDSIEVHRFGPAPEHARADQVHDPLLLEVDVVDPSGVMRIVRAEIVGRSLPLCGPPVDSAAGRTSILTFNRAKDATADDWTRAEELRGSLRAFVDHAVLSASGILVDGPHACLRALSSPKPDRRVFAALSRDEASNWLRSVIRELLSRPHGYFLPCEAVFVHEQGRAGEGAVRPFLDEARSRLRASDGPPALRSAYGPVPRPAEHPIPDEADARTMIERRFRVFFDKLEAQWP